MRVGIDVQSIAEVRGAVAAFGERYLRRVYTAGEIADSMTDDLGIASGRLALRFATKEATIKVLAVTDRVPAWTDVELLGTARAPSVRLSGVAREVAAERRLRDFRLTVTSAGDIAMAVVIAH